MPFISWLSSTYLFQTSFPKQNMTYRKLSGIPGWLSRFFPLCLWVLTGVPPPVWLPNRSFDDTSGCFLLTVSVSFFASCLLWQKAVFPPSAFAAAEDPWIFGLLLHKLVIVSIDLSKMIPRQNRTGHQPIEILEMWYAFFQFSTRIQPVQAECSLSIQVSFMP